MIIFDADDPLVLSGTYDREGYTPAERRAKERREMGRTRKAGRRQGLTPEQAEEVHRLHTGEAVEEGGGLVGPPPAESSPPPARGDIHLAEMLALEQLEPCRTNPRRAFDADRLKELADSVRLHGVLEPLIVRPGDEGRFEIVAGERRYRAAQLAGLTEAPVIIRPLTDEQVLEFSLIENMHREDLAPLELARGFRRLIRTNPTKHSAESIAARIGMSPAWVWDRLKLLDLIPAAQQLLEQERIGIGHAILLSRLKTADQHRAIAHDDDSSTAHRGVGLWRPDAGFTFDDGNGGKPGPYDGLKPCSVRELEAWINDHVRFDVAHAAQAQPLTFEPVLDQVKQAQAQPGRGKKVIAITFEHFTPPDARDDSERTYGSSSWRFADGQEHTQTYPRKTYTAARCEHAVLGVVAAGDRRGEAFEVCIARDKCTVHWKKEITAREKAATQRAGGATAKREAAAARRERQEAERREQRQQRWKAFSSALKTAVITAAARVQAGKMPKPLYERVLADQGLPKQTTPSDLSKALLLQSIRRRFDRYMFDGQESEYVAWAKALGVDVKACEPKAAGK